MKKQKLIRHSVFPVEELLPLLGPSVRRENRKWIEMADGAKIKLSSRRFPCFKKNLACVNPDCNRVGTVLAAERHVCDATYHLNLYAIDEDGEEVLMTVDHKKPLAKKGSNFQKNLQTMCIECNEAKGDKYE